MRKSLYDKLVDELAKGKDGEIPGTDGRAIFQYLWQL